MTRPPVAFFICVNGFVADGMPSLQAVAGELNDQLRQSLDAGLPPLWDVLDQQQAWETFA